MVYSIEALSSSGSCNKSAAVMSKSADTRLLKTRKISFSGLEKQSSEDVVATGIGFYGGQTLTAVTETKVDTQQPDNVEENHLSSSPPNTLQESTYQVKKRSLPYIEEKQKQSNTTVVKLYVSDETSLGIVISGGGDKSSPVSVASLVPGGLAEKSDVLEPDDVILSINGTSTAGLRQEHIVTLLKPVANSVVEIEIEYELPEPAQNLTPTVAKCTKVGLARDGFESFGLIFRGGICVERRSYRPLMITHVRPGSSADRDGRIKAGDRILEVNGIDVTKASLPEAMDMLNECTKTVIFLVEYNVSVIDAVHNASSPLLVEIDRPFCCSLGIDFVSVLLPDGNAIVISNVMAASIADRCGALHVGDRVLSINDVALDSVSVSEATRQLQYDIGERLVLEILPRCCSRHRVISAVASSQLTGSTLSITSISSVDRYASIGGLSNHSGITVDSMATQVGSAVATESTNSRPNSRPPVSRRSSSRIQQDNLASVISLLDGATRNESHACHVDVTDVVLISDRDGGHFGIAIDSTECCGETFTKPPVITYLEPSGIAEKSGLLQEGDRVLSVNGWSLRGRSVSDVSDMIAVSRGRLTLRIEFDVADSVVAGSGTYLVKMAKRGAGVGISISCPRNRLPGQPLVISDVRKGSVAHRTGTISPGDYLLAVGDVWLDDYTLEDAARVLTSVDRIVKLRIQKNECYADEPDPKSIISYNVELPRFAGPLGISLTSKVDVPGSVIIANLTPDGLAEKTGALRVGDHILAINGVRLQGKNIEEAVRLLPTCDEGINIKIMRCLSSPGLRNESQGTGNRSSSRVISLDSVLELWDGWSHDSNIMWAINHRSTARDLKINGGKKNSSSGSAEVFCDLDQGRDTASLCHKPKSPMRGDPRLNRLPSYHSYQGDFNSLTKTYDSINSPSSVDVTTSLPTSDSAAVIPGREGNAYLEGLEYIVPPVLKTDEPVISSVFESSVSPSEELIETTLLRETESEGFGFSLSNGINETGVFIGAVKEPGPAADRLRPYDRILQVNGVLVTELMCTDVVPIIARTGTQLALVVSRRQVTASNQSDDVIQFDARRRSSADFPSLSSGFSERYDHHITTLTCNNDIIAANNNKQLAKTVLGEMKEDSV